MARRRTGGPAPHDPDSKPIAFDDRCFLTHRDLSERFEQVSTDPLVRLLAPRGKQLVDIRAAYRMTIVEEVQGRRLISKRL
jgi:hypothetical protein